MERGRRFHELARQHFLGLNVAGQVAAAEAEIKEWWAALASSPPELPANARYYPEAGLSTPLGGYRLAARYDLLAIAEDAARIVDWKTGRPLPSVEVLRGDVQTRVYLYVLAEGGAAYHTDRPLPPEALSLLYWQPRGPEQIPLAYSAAQRDEDRAFLEALVAAIAAHAPADMGPVQDEQVCASCAYAPLCGRASGGVWEWDPQEDPFPPEAETWPIG